MKNTIFASTLLIAAVAVPSRLTGQVPDGSDINKAIPIVFGQIVTDIADVRTVPNKVYSINLAKGQQLTGLLSIPVGRPSAAIELSILPPDRKTIGSCTWGCNKGSLAGDYTTGGRSVTFTYQVAAAGTYYILIDVNTSGVNYELQLTAQGTPINVPNPATAGCLSGRVDYLTYSLQLIATGLADEVSVGGQRACASCTVKAPLYPEIVTRLENALRSKVNVEACYDSGGSIFQIKLVQP